MFTFIQELVLIMISAVFQEQEDKQHDFSGHIPDLKLRFLPHVTHLFRDLTHSRPLALQLLFG